MEMQQLLSMGFPDELAAQALAATGGKSTVKATEWILTHKSSSASNSNNPSPPPPPPPPPPPFQPKLDRFFHFQSKPKHSTAPSSSPSPSVTPSTQPQPQPIDLEQDAEADAEQQEQEQEADAEAEAEESTPLSKRVKLLPSTSTSTSTSQHKSSSFFNRFHHLKSAADKDKDRDNKTRTHEPLYERMRPRTLDDVVGQDHLLATNSLLRSAIERNRLPSIVFWGPPGTGKTTIAKAIVNSATSSQKQQQQQCPCYRFVSLSAVTSGVKDVRDAVDEARKFRFKSNQRTVLFVDEVHRFNKSQQDSFLPVIEDGSIVFTGATTENPSFHLITPLLSRCRVLTLNPLKPHHVALLLNRAVNDLDKGLVQSVGFQVGVSEEVVDFIGNNCDGDARVALNALEIAAVTAAARVEDVKPSKEVMVLEREQDMTSQTNEGYMVVPPSAAVVTLDDAREALQCKHLAYDKAGEEHYNLISALHKSMRGSDANAAIYWVARMLEGGEEPLYIARRLIRFASEDVGLADPSALSQAVSCYQACHFLGMPECNVILAQCAAYLALAPKSVSVYRAIEAAQKAVRESVGQNEGVPLHLRNAPTKLMKEIGYGKGYIYPPDNPSLTQSYLPPSLQGYKFLDWPDRHPSDE